MQYIYIYIYIYLLEIEIPWYNHKELFSTETYYDDDDDDPVFLLYQSTDISFKKYSKRACFSV